METFFVFLFAVLINSGKFLFLNRTPLFGDEALYCYLGYTFATKPFFQAFDFAVNYWKDSPGLLLWNASNFLLFGQSMPIEICRLTSLFSSTIALFIFFLLSKLLIADKRIYYAAFVFFAFNPFTFFFDRTVLMDVPLVSFVLLFIYFSLKFLKEGKKRYLIFSLLATFAMISTKLNSLFVLVVPMYFTIFQKNHFPLRKIYYTLLFIVTSLLMIFFYHYTRVWETAFYHVDRNIFDFQLIIKTFRNLRIIASWYRQFFTPFIFPLVALGIFFMVRKKVLFPLIILAFFISVYSGVSSHLFPRYLLFTVPFVALVVGFATFSRFGIALLGIVILLFLKNDYLIIVAPSQAILAREVRYEYFEDWGSGVGTTKAMHFLKKSNPSYPLLVPTDLFGLFHILSLEYTPHIREQLIFFRNDSELGKILRERSEKVLVVSTPYHEWIAREVTKYPQHKLIYSSNDQQRNSILIYEL